MQPYEPPQIVPRRTARSSRGFIVISLSAVLILVGMWQTIAGAFKILDTAPIMGTLVDAAGNPIPVQGYSQFWLGLTLVVVFSPILFLAALKRAF